MPTRAAHLAGRKTTRSILPTGVRSSALRRWVQPPDGFLAVTTLASKPPAAMCAASLILPHNSPRVTG